MYERKWLQFCQQEKWCQIPLSHEYTCAKVLHAAAQAGHDVQEALCLEMRWHGSICQAGHMVRGFPHGKRRMHRELKPQA